MVDGYKIGYTVKDGKEIRVILESCLKQLSKIQPMKGHFLVDGYRTGSR
ncbi:hypothetical protein IIW_00322 [Bacillus cereus VD136]|nr:hypothetical protein IIW_00322 [Bacillus cereus VD136]